MQLQFAGLLLGARPFVGLCGLLSLAMLCASPTVAGTIFFSDSTDNLFVTLTPDLVARGSTSSCSGETCTVILRPPTPAGGGASWEQQVNILEQNQSVSDFITTNPTLDANFNVLLFTIVFTSDTDGVPLHPPSGNIVREDGTVQTASSINWSTAIGPVPVVDAIRFQSDVLEGPQTPEPAALLLTGGGLLGLGLLRRRRRLLADSAPQR